MEAFNNTLIAKAILSHDDWINEIMKSNKLDIYEKRLIEFYEYNMLSLRCYINNSQPSEVEPLLFQIKDALGLVLDFTGRVVSYQGVSIVSESYRFKLFKKYCSIDDIRRVIESVQTWRDIEDIVKIVYLRDNLNILYNRAIILYQKVNSHEIMYDIFSEELNEIKSDMQRYLVDVSRLKKTDDELDLLVSFCNRVISDTGVMSLTELLYYNKG